MNCALNARSRPVSARPLPFVFRTLRFPVAIANQAGSAPAISSFCILHSSFKKFPPHIPPHLLTLAVLLLASAAQAATGSPAGPTASAGSPSSGGWELLIPVLVPVGIAGLKMLLPKIPSVWLPVIAPVVGAALEIVLHFAGLASGTGLVGALLGSAGVGLREILDQLRKMQGEGQA